MEHTSPARGRYRLAVLLVLSSSFLNSANGLLMRSIEEASPWQVISIRLFALSAVLTLVYLVQQPRGTALSAIRSLGPWSLLGAVMIAVANSGLVWSLSQTTVANTMFILSTVPFLTAVLGWIFLRERIEPGLWVAMLVSLVGISIMIADGLGRGALLGDAIALMTAFAFACFVVVLRHGRSRNMLPVVILGSLLAAVFAAAMADFDLLGIPAADLALAFVWGGVCSSVVHVLFVFGSRYVLGAELTILVLVEFILAPVWVWLVFAERPSLLALAGGALVLLSVGSRGVLALYRGG